MEINVNKKIKGKSSRQHTIVCGYCGKEVTKSSSKARFCNDYCRVSYYYSRKSNPEVYVGKIKPQVSSREKETEQEMLKLAIYLKLESYPTLNRIYKSLKNNETDSRLVRLVEKTMNTWGLNLPNALEKLEGQYKKFLIN